MVNVSKDRCTLSNVPQPAAEGEHRLKDPRALSPENLLFF